MGIKDTLVTINKMVDDGIIEKYAIGGAVGATFYMEASETEDIDIFITFKAVPGSLLLTTEPIYRYLLENGASQKGEYLIISDWPVQFLPPPTPLEEDALENALEHKIEELTTHVFSLEHLAAIACKRRPKNKSHQRQIALESVL